MRETVFFMLAFFLFFLTVKMARYWIEHKGVQTNFAYIVCGLTYTLIVVSLYYLANLQNTHEGFWDVTPASQCKGGPYMWQGDSEQARYCRDLAKTPEGRVEISGYNCPSSYVGSPGLPFYYSSLSDDNWRNTRCEDLPSCEHIDVGLCSLEKQT